MKYFSFLLLLLLCGSACSADRDITGPIGGEDMPYFSVSYHPDSSGEKVLVAGVDNVYLYTDFQIGGDDIMTCTGTFTEVQCLADNCPGRLHFEFRNTQPGSVILPGPAFHPGDHIYKRNEPSSGGVTYHTVFQVDTASGFTDFFWSINNFFYAAGSQLTVDFPVGSDSVLVSLQAFNLNGPVSTVQRWISLPGGVAFPGVDISILPQPNNYQLTAFPTGNYSGLVWNNGQTQPTFTESTLLDSYAITAGSLSGQQAMASLSGIPANLTTHLATTNFHTSVTVTPIDTLQRGTVALQWTDQEGNIWRSDRGPQLPGTRFQVTDSKPYELNELGQYTWQMRVIFNCYLYNDSGERRSFSGEGRIAVAYPGY